MSDFKLHNWCRFRIVHILLLAVAVAIAGTAWVALFRETYTAYLGKIENPENPDSPRISLIVYSNKGYFEWYIDDAPYGTLNWLQISNSATYRYDEPLGATEQIDQGNSMPECGRRSYARLYEFLGGTNNVEEAVLKDAVAVVVPESLLIRHNCKND